MRENRSAVSIVLTVIKWLILCAASVCMACIFIYRQQIFDYFTPPPELLRPQGEEEKEKDQQAMADVLPTFQPLTEEEVEYGLFRIYKREADEVMKRMSLEEKVGQVLWVCRPQSAGTKTEGGISPAGFILFRDDFGDKPVDQVKSEIRAYQNASRIPLLIGVDEEGGTVVRVSASRQLTATAYPSPQELYAKGGLDAVRSDARTKSKVLLSLGINVNLAPVADVSQSPSDYIYKRAIGLDAAGTGDYVEAVVKEMDGAGIGMALKHFPGYGNNEDTHGGMAVDKRSLDSLRDSDLIPFSRGIEAGADGVLVSHNIVESIDSAPASLSAKVIAILRDEMGFTGVIMTDDLSMKAIEEFTDGRNPAPQALAAGNDLLITSDFQGSYDALLAAVKDGTVPRQRLDDAVTRVLAWKKSLGLTIK